MTKAVILQDLPTIPDVPEIDIREAIGETVNQIFNRFEFLVPLLKIVGWLLAALIVLKILFVIGRFFREGTIIKLLKGISDDIAQIRKKFAPGAKESDEGQDKKKIKK